MTVRLVDHGYPFKKIIEGRKWIGRVYRHSTTGRYIGKIGHIEYEASSERVAFDEVTARYFGFDDANSLRSSNRAVSSQRRASRAAAREVADAFLRGDSRPLMRLFDQMADKAKALQPDRTRDKK